VLCSDKHWLIFLEGLANWSCDIGSSEPTEALPSTKMPGDYHLDGNMRMTFIGWAQDGRKRLQLF